MGPREACIARELTKVYEEFILFELEDYSSLPDDLLGEISIIIGPPKKNFKNSAEEMLNVLDEEIQAGESLDSWPEGWLKGSKAGLLKKFMNICRKGKIRIKLINKEDLE